MPRVLVTDGTGFLGGHVARALPVPAHFDRDFGITPGSLAGGFRRVFSAA